MRMGARTRTKIICILPILAALTTINFRVMEAAAATRDTVKCITALRWRGGLNSQEIAYVCQNATPDTVECVTALRWRGGLNSEEIVRTCRQDYPPAFGTRIILQRQGELRRGDSVASDGSLYDEYSFQGDRGQTVTIVLDSPDFDTYLILIDPGNRQIAENNDISRTNLNSAIAVTLPQTGIYRAIVTTRDVRGGGRYLFTVGE